MHDCSKYNVHINHNIKLNHIQYTHACTDERDTANIKGREGERERDGERGRKRVRNVYALYNLNIMQGFIIVIHLEESTYGASTQRLLHVYIRELKKNIVLCC